MAGFVLQEQDGEEHDVVPEADLEASWLGFVFIEAISAVLKPGMPQ